jgi:hypothetical protein
MSLSEIVIALHYLASQVADVELAHRMRIMADELSTYISKV